MPETDFNVSQIVNSITDGLNTLDQLKVPTEAESIAAEANQGTFYEDLIVQNADGTWSSVKTIQEPIETVEQRQKNQYNAQKELVNNYYKLSIPYDKEISEYNTQINDKKIQIVNLFNNAVTNGCSLKTFQPNSNTLLINCIACGIGSTVYRDTFLINRYLNMENNETDNLFDSTAFDVDALKDQYPLPYIEQTLYGKGYLNVSVINDVSKSELGHFISITDTSSVCAGIAVSIKNLATDIDNLRKDRDSKISSVNVLKSTKNQEELAFWSFQNYISNEASKISLVQKLSNVTNIVEDIVMDKLLVYLDAARGYSVKTKTNTQTGVTVIESIINLASDGTSVSGGDFSPTYDQIDGPSIWFDQYGITGKYLNLPKSYVLNSDEGIDGCGSAELYGDASYTIESWFKVLETSYLSSNVNTGGASIVGIASTAGIGIQVYEPEMNKVKINFGSRGTGSLDNTTKIDVDTWYHAVAVREKGVGSKIYLNSKLDASSDNTSILNIISPTNSVMRVGFCSNNYISQYFPGKISVIRFYSKALSQNEVLKNFNASKTRYGYA